MVGKVDGSMDRSVDGEVNGKVDGKMNGKVDGNSTIVQYLILPLVQKRCPNDRELAFHKSYHIQYDHVGPSRISIVSLEYIIHSFTYARCYRVKICQKSIPTCIYH